MENLGRETCSRKLVRKVAPYPSWLRSGRRDWQISRENAHRTEKGPPTTPTCEFHNPRHQHLTPLSPEVGTPYVLVTPVQYILVNSLFTFSYLRIFLRLSTIYWLGIAIEIFSLDPLRRFRGHVKQAPIAATHRRSYQAR